MKHERIAAEELPVCDEDAHAWRAAGLDAEGRAIAEAACCGKRARYEWGCWRLVGEGATRP